MSLVAFSELPDHARLWIFPAERPLTIEEQRQIADDVEAGLSEWTAHGSPVSWALQIVHERFLMIGVDETRTQLTGCSIDNAVGKIRGLETQLGLSLLDNSRVFYRREDGIWCRPRSEFKDQVTAGAIDDQTVVFDNIIPSVRDWREGRWEIPFGRSWHARAFPRSS